MLVLGEVDQAQEGINWPVLYKVHFRMIKLNKLCLEEGTETMEYSSIVVCTLSSRLSRSEQSEPVVCNVFVLNVTHGVVCHVHAVNLASGGVCTVHVVTQQAVCGVLKLTYRVVCSAYVIN